MATVFPSAVSALQKQYKTTTRPAVPPRDALPEVTFVRVAGTTDAAFYTECVTTYSDYQSYQLNGKRYYFYTSGVQNAADFGGIVPMLQGKEDADGNRTITIYAQAAHAGAPAVTTTSSDSSWNAGARSIDTIGEYGFYEFSVDVDAAAFDRGYIGLVAADASPANSVSILDSEYAFYLRSDDPDTGAPRSRIRRNGNNISGAASKIGVSVSAGARYRILRMPAGVTFQVLDRVTGDKLFEYTPTGYAPTGDMRLDVSLHRSLDAITYPICVTPDTDIDGWEEAVGVGADVMDFQATLSPFLAYTGINVTNPYGRISRSLEPPTATWEMVPQNTVIAPTEPFRAFLGRGLNRIVGTAPGLELDLFTLTTVESLDRSFTIGDRNKISFAPLTASLGSSPSPTDITASFYLWVLDGLALQNHYTTEHLGAGFTATYTVTGAYAQQDVFELPGVTASLTMPVELPEIELTLTLATLGVNATLKRYGQRDTLVVNPQYVMHAETNAAWKYDELIFSSMVTTDDGSVFALDPENGLRVLNTAGGIDPTPAATETPTQYFIDFGGSDYDVATRKNLDSVWLGMEYSGTFETSGEAVGDVLVSTEVSSEYTYPVISTPPQSRAVCGRGLYGRTIRVRYQWTTTREFMIDSLEVSINTGQNRRVP